MTTTALTPFQPKGEIAEWQLIYDHLLDRADFGQVISYEQLDRVLGRSFVYNRSPLYKARSILGSRRKRWLVSVPGVGYRVIQAREHLHVAEGHKRRAKRQLSTMVQVAEVTDLRVLSPEELTIFDNQQRLNYALYVTAVHHEHRLNRIEAVLRQEGRL